MSADRRDFVGYGQTPPNPKWPNESKLALSFVINYEEGAESCVLFGDGQSEHQLCDIVGASAIRDRRDVCIESLYEYGSRAGFWRLYRNFTERDIPATVFGCGRALEENEEAAKAMIGAEWEIATHGYRWLDYNNNNNNSQQDREMVDINLAVAVQTKICGYRPYGFYQGKPNVSTIRHILDEGGFVYNNDVYSDDLPYWSTQYFHKRSNSVNGIFNGEICNGTASNGGAGGEAVRSRAGLGDGDKRSPMLMIPYTLSVNDMKFATPQGFNCGDQFFSFLKDTFDCLYEEGQKGSPKMMSVGLHCRIAGHPGRMQALKKFLDYVLMFKDIWICRRIDLALHWYRHHNAESPIPDHVRSLMEQKHLFCQPPKIRDTA